jgi:O-succinylbenzoic acid--CoA ligase
MDPSLPQQIDWLSLETHVLWNPRWDAQTLRKTDRLFTQAPSLSAHLWIQSSGSSVGADESAKWIALSKRAFLISAAAVNRHLHGSAQDIWGLALPLFHVGGLSILARAFLTQSRVARFQRDWDPAAFANWMQDERVTLLSLVPTQLFDLVKINARAPKILRAVVIGGAALSDSLYREATVLGWPVLPSFGMTELCSQIATAEPGSRDLKILSHVELKTDPDDSLWIKSEALFTGFLQERQGQVHWETPVFKDGFWKSSDRARLQGGFILPLGRAADYVKVKGEGVDLHSLRTRFAEWWTQRSAHDTAIVALPDERDGHRLIVAIENAETAVRAIIQEWNSSCFPIERLEARSVPRIPRSALGKVLWSQLNEILTSSKS